jgi:hypothetical protein
MKKCIMLYLCILCVYNVIFLMTIFETAIASAKNTLNSMEQIRNVLVIT